MLPAAGLCKSSLHVQGFECTAWCVRLAGDHQSGNQEHIVFDSRPPTPFWGGCVCQRPADVSFRLVWHVGFWHAVCIQISRPPLLKIIWADFGVWDGRGLRVGCILIASLLLESRFCFAC